MATSKLSLEAQTEARAETPHLAEKRGNRFPLNLAVLWEKISIKYYTVKDIFCQFKT